MVRTIVLLFLTIAAGSGWHLTGCPWFRWLAFVLLMLVGVVGAASAWRTILEDRKRPFGR